MNKNVERGEGSFGDCFWVQDMDVEPKIGGKLPKWMVYFMENPMKIHDLGGPPLFLETPIYEQNPDR